MNQDGIEQGMDSPLELPEEKALPTP